MKKKLNIQDRHVSRRQFLIGTGGSMLLLPLLSSLVPEKVLAAITPKRRFLVWVNGLGVDTQHLYPADYADGTLAAGMESVYYKPLSSFAGPISRMIDSSFAPLYPQMNLLQGLSLTGGLYQGHNNTVLAGSHSGLRAPGFGASLDVIMEKSANVYKPGEVVGSKAVRIYGGPDSSAYTWEIANGLRVTPQGITGDKNLFNNLFASMGTGGVATQDTSNKKLVVDKVFGDLQTLQSNPRLSSDDKITLDRYMTAIRDLQVKVNATPPACTKPTMTFQASGNGNVWQLPWDPKWGVTNVGAMLDNYLEMIKIAFMCDLTRVVYVSQELWDDRPIAPSSEGGLHHEAPSSEIQADRQNYGLKKVAKFAGMLNGVTDPFGGGTILDNSLLLWTNELGAWTTAHNTFSIPSVTFGKNGGYFKTGYHVDYRQRPLTNVLGFYPGRPYKQLLQSIMLSMGVTQAEYSAYGDGQGFGEFKPGIDQFGHVNATLFSRYASEHNLKLPFVSI